MGECTHPRSQTYADEHGRSRCGACGDVWNDYLKVWMVEQDDTDTREEFDRLRRLEYDHEILVKGLRLNGLVGFDDVIAAIERHTDEFRAKEHIVNYLRKERREGRL